MKKKNRLTTFAKLVILVLIIFGIRYFYYNQEDILSGKIFNSIDTIEIEQDTTVLDNPKYKDIDISKKNKYEEDTLLFNLNYISDSVFTIQISNCKDKIILFDTLTVIDSIFVKLSEEKKINAKILFSNSKIFNK